MGDVVIELEHVGVAFHAQRSIGDGRYWALEDVNLQLRRGERLGVIGRNGAGKSTLLRVLAGILAPDRGRVRRSGISCQLMSLSLGFVGHLSGRDNAVLSGLLLGLRRREIVARLPAIREFSELGDFFEQPISTYSAGMNMRLAFSVAMQAEPDVLLIDEVLAVGDADIGLNLLACSGFGAESKNAFFALCLSHGLLGSLLGGLPGGLPGFRLAGIHVQQYLQDGRQRKLYKRA